MKMMVTAIAMAPWVGLATTMNATTMTTTTTTMTMMTTGNTAGRRRGNEEDALVLVAEACHRPWLNAIA